MKKDFRFLKVGNESINVPKDVMDVLRDRYNKALTESQAYEKLKSMGMDEEKAKRLSKNPGNFTMGDFGVKNESIDKQEWSMFNGLRKDAEKEIGNSQKEFKTIEELDRWCKQNGYMYEERSKGYYSLTNGKDFTTAHVGNATGDEYNAEIQRLTKKAEQLRRMGQGRSAMEIEKQIEKLGKELRELGNSKTGNRNFAIIQKTAWGSTKIAEWEANSPEEAVREFEQANPSYANGKKGKIVANSKTGNATPEEMEVKYKGYTITYFPYQKKYMVRHPNEVSGLVQKHFTSVDEAKKAIDKKSVGNADKVDNLKRARNAMTVADLKAQIKKNEDYIKSLAGKSVDGEGWPAKSAISEAQDEIERMKARIADLQGQGNKKIGNLDSVEEGDYVDVRVHGEIVEGVVRKVQGTQALVTVDGVDQWFPIRNLKESN